MAVDFTLMNAMCRLYEHNMKVLHWGACGPKFDRIHGLCDEYEAMFHTDVDFAGETGMRIGQPPPAFDHIMNVLEECDHDFVVCAFKSVSYKETIATINKMLDDMLWVLAQIHEQEWIEEPINMGIKAEVESLFNKYDFQRRYLQQRRAMDVPAD